jgi:hypothetical protein
VIMRCGRGQAVRGKGSKSFDAGVGLLREATR